MRDDVDSSIRQFTEAWRRRVRERRPHGGRGRRRRIHIFSGRPIAFFNVAILTGRGISSEAFEARADQACTWASTTHVPWLFIVTPTPPDPGIYAVSILDGCGLGPMMPMTGMLAQHVAPVASLPEGLELTVPQDDSACAAIVDVNALAYGMDLEAGKDLIGTRSFWRISSRCWAWRTASPPPAPPS